MSTPFVPRHPDILRAEIHELETERAGLISLLREVVDEREDCPYDGISSRLLDKITAAITEATQQPDEKLIDSGFYPADPYKVKATQQP